MNSENLPQFSVVLPVYRGDEPQHLDIAIESLETQTVPPTELIVVEDGPLTSDLESVLDKWVDQFPGILHRSSHKTNQGLSSALRTGVEVASYDFVARMDADDVSIPHRFETQLRYMTDHPEVDVLGGYIAEFSTDPDNVDALRKVPIEHSDIYRKARFRSPVNHGTVMFRRKRVLDVGNYRPVDRMEDYDLWVRLLLDGATFANIPEVLLKVRAGEDLYRRRGGWEYAREEIRTHTEFFRRGFTTFPIFLFNLVFRTSLRLVPSGLRKLMYRLFAREDNISREV